MKVLITGATGLIGKEIVKQSLSKNYSVHFLTSSMHKLNHLENCKGFYWNPAKGEIDITCFNGVTSIINLAGSPVSSRWTTKNKKQILESRLHSLATLFKGLQQVDNSMIESFVSASAIGVYPSSETNVYKEDETMVEDNFLGEVVKEWEKSINTFDVFNFTVAKIRIGIVLSKNGGALSELKKPIDYYVGAAFGNGKQWQSWIHVKDLAAIFLFVAKNNLKGIYNGVGPNPVSNSKLVSEIAKVAKKPLFLPNIPKMMMYLILGEMANLLFTSQNVSSKKIEQEGFVFQFQTISLALEDMYLSKN